MSWNEPIYFWLLLFIPIWIILGVLYFKKKSNNFNHNVGLNFELLKKDLSHTKQYMKFSLIISAAIFIIISLASPMYGEESKVIQKKGIDIVLALDISRSMLAEDISPSRIDRSKMELSSFIKKLKGDAIGIIAFSGLAYPQSPLTLDYHMSQIFLKNIEVGDIPIGGTNIEMAIKTAINLFQEGGRTTKSKLLIIISDGESHDGDALEAARKAKEKGVVIYTIGIGSLSGELIPLKDKKGRNKGYLEKDGKPVLTKLNPKMLSELAVMTGGKYYGFVDNSIDLSKLLGEISQYEKDKLKEESKILKVERYQITLFIAILLLFLASIISEKRYRGVV